jgi:iron complex outermembrane receptor protein
VEFSTSPPISGTSNAAAVFIRGIGQNDFLATNDPGVGIYLDGVYIARSVGGVLKINDIERVEILRGPQGTLLGKNTIGGAIHVISRRPADTFQAHVGITGGSDDRRDLSLSAEGPLITTLKGRISFLDENRDGYVKRLLDGKDQGNINRQTTKGVFQWRPNDWADLRLTADYTHQRQNGAAEVVVEIAENPATLYKLFNTLVATPQFSTQWDSRWVPAKGSFTTFGTGPSQDDIDIGGIGLTGNFDISNTTTLTSITSYRTMNGTYARDTDASPLIYGHQLTKDDQSQISQELRLTSNNQRNITWTAGLFYFKEDIDNHQDIIIANGLFEAIGLDLTSQVTNRVDVVSYAAFGQASWDITSQLSLTGGTRITREQKDFFVDVLTVNNGAQVIGPEQKPTDVWWNSLPMFSVDYQYDDNSLLYFSYSEGFKSGGYNGRLIAPPVDPETGEPIIDAFDPEESKNFELGFKHQLNNFYLQGSVFSTDYTNLQVSVLTTGLNNSVAAEIDNAAKVRINGAELELQANIYNVFRINTGLGYLDAKYTELNSNTKLDKNAKLQKIPDWSVHVRGEYNFNISNYGDLLFILEGSYKSKSYNDPLNTEAIAQPRFSLLNSSLAWRNNLETLTITLFGTNLTNKKYFTSGASALESFGASDAAYGRPREWGITVNYDFD